MMNHCMANAFRKEKDLSIFLQFALRLAIHAYNRVLYTIYGETSSKTPYELLYSMVVNLILPMDMFIPFSVCYVEVRH